MTQRYDNILDMIGNTPLVEIRKLNPNKNVRIFAKLESCNPGGSIKDRAALFMIEKALERGELTGEKTILEATSGNTGIGLALVAAAMGYKITLVLSESASDERKKILRALGAELVLTPAHLGTDGAIELVYEMLREYPDKYYVPDQHNNEDNILAHYHGTAEEIWQQTGNKITMVVASLGTSGTAMGISRRLKEYNENIRVVGVEPYLRHKIQGLKNMKESYRPGIFDTTQLDEKVNILDEDAFEMARRLAREEGIMAGMSSGAAMHVALKKAREMTGGIIVVIFPDGGERYLSTDLYADKKETTVRLYNTLTNTKEFFKPIHSEKLLVHSCGPTVHEVPHIGTYRRVIFSDMVVRYLNFKGYEVKHVTNIIDMADRSIKGAELAGMDVKEFSERYTKIFYEDLDKLNIRHEGNYPKASENVDEMIRLVEKLVDRGYAYEKLKSVYFDISRLDDYGVLSNIDLTKVQHSRTVDQDDYEKDNPVDFTLLKRSNLAELKKGIYYKTRWGNVRPSWHLECAAISLKYLADTFDIYISGADIVFPHCENVMAIGKAATGEKMANFWLNAELVMCDGKKMSRSLENTFTMKDLEKRGYTGKEIRYFLLSSHYRKPLNFSFAALDTASNTIRRLDNFIQRLIHAVPGEGCDDVHQLIYDVQNQFSAAMDDDFNVSGALAAVFEFVKAVNPLVTQKRLSVDERDRIIAVMRKINAVFGVIDFEEEQLDERAHTLLSQREAARRSGKWEESDRLRERLSDMGVLVHDTPDGTIWSLK
jgi:cysteinyl-tRNA synthetase